MSVSTLTRFPPAAWSELFVRNLSATEFLRSIPVTTAERDFILGQDGQIVFNSSIDSFQAWYNDMWNIFGTGIVGPTGPTGPTSLILEASGVLTVNDIENLNSTGVVLLPAQGTGTVIEPTGIVFQVVYGGTPYTDADAFALGVFRSPVSIPGDLVNQAIYFIGLNGLLGASQSYFENSRASSTINTGPQPLTNVVNQPIWLYNLGTNPSGGNGTISWTLTYRLQSVI
jgi:hypothetical protein